MKSTFFSRLAYGVLMIAALPVACNKDDGYGDDPPANTTYSLSATLSGAQEVPANASAASGTLTGTYDAASYKITYSITWTNLSAGITAAHFHGPALAGQNAGVAVGIAGLPTGTTSGNVANSVVITQSQGADLIAGKYYFNIHTTTFPAGEIRGQVASKKN
jgi:hypothetical protein